MNDNEEDQKYTQTTQLLSPLMSPKMSGLYDTNTPSFMSSSPRLNFKPSNNEKSPTSSVPLSKKPKISTTPKLSSLSSKIHFSQKNEDNDINLYDINDDDDVIDEVDDNNIDDDDDDDDFLDGFALGNDDDDDDEELRHDDVIDDDDENDGDNEDDEDDEKKLRVINRMLRKLTSSNFDKDVNMDDDVSDDDSSDYESVLRMPLPSPYRVPIVCDPPPPTPPPSRLGTMDENDSAFSLYPGNSGSRVLEFLSPSFLNCESGNVSCSIDIKGRGGNGDGGSNEEEEFEIKNPIPMGTVSVKTFPSIYELSRSNISCNYYKYYFL